MFSNMLLKTMATNNIGTTTATTQVITKAKLVPRDNLKHKVRGIKDEQTGKMHHGGTVLQYNHEISLGHIQMPHETCMKIAAGLQQGMIIDRMIDNI